MYNIHQYREGVRQQEAARQQQSNQAKWLARHLTFKDESSNNSQQRVSNFLKDQSLSPISVEDDHFTTWRIHRQFRDVEDQTKFLGFKAFRHRPDYDVGKFYTERQRKQIKQLARRKSPLVDKNIIPEQLRNRSLRSQGPFNPECSFRPKMSEKELLQPKMRYSNVTDRQRSLSMSQTFDDKFRTLYNTFNLKKSKIGLVKISPKKGDQKSMNIDLMSTYSETVNKDKTGFYFSALNEEENSYAPPEAGKCWPPSEGRMSGSKLYFKTARTLALHGDREAKSFLLQSQYDRARDLSNLSRNRENEVFVKKPVL